MLEQNLTLTLRLYQMERIITGGPLGEPSPEWQDIVDIFKTDNYMPCALRAEKGQRCP
jgi:hypothetical protein